MALPRKIQINVEYRSGGLKLAVELPTDPILLAKFAEGFLNLAGELYETSEGLRRYIDPNGPDVLDYPKNATENGMGDTLRRYSMIGARKNAKNEAYREDVTSVPSQQSAEGWAGGCDRNSHCFSEFIDGIRSDWDSMTSCRHSSHSSRSSRGSTSPPSRPCGGILAPSPPLTRIRHSTPSSSLPTQITPHIHPLHRETPAPVKKRPLRHQRYTVARLSDTNTKILSEIEEVEKEAALHRTSPKPWWRNSGNQEVEEKIGKQSLRRTTSPQQHSQASTMETAMLPPTLSWRSQPDRHQKQRNQHQPINNNRTCPEVPRKEPLHHYTYHYPAVHLSKSRSASDYRPEVPHKNTDRPPRRPSRAREPILELPNHSTVVIYRSHLRGHVPPPAVCHSRSEGRKSFGLRRGSSLRRAAEKVWVPLKDFVTGI
ncbi:hypothetical protein EJ08DRAFT_703896 [Tothia fuscella]|uniref:Uncharacterized protein n=1 Tax=Tothia fuscella TaxID=1048955 RepID=A0A9P4TSD1_9PEZI|nr:hypothetical protein EJ08DRAFT_703896 [Tothia fuscella]